MGKNEVVVVEHERGAIQLSTNLIREYICQAATDKEIFVFLKLCKAQRLNPWLREAYLVKYGTNPATIITGKETFTKRAQKNPLCDGWAVTSKGTPPDMTATAEVYLKNYRMPISVTVDYSEYVALKGDGKPNKMWSEKPKTMLKKVALVQALREAFPEDLGGLYDQTEINSIQSELPTDVIEVVDENTGEITEVKKSATVKAKETPPEAKQEAAGEVKQPEVMEEGAEPVELINDGQRKMLFAVMKSKFVLESDLKSYLINECGIQSGSTKDIPKRMVNDIKAWLEKPREEAPEPGSDG